MSSTPTVHVFPPPGIIMHETSFQELLQKLEASRLEMAETETRHSEETEALKAQVGALRESMAREVTQQRLNAETAAQAVVESLKVKQGWDELPGGACALRVLGRRQGLVRAARAWLGDSSRRDWRACPPSRRPSKKHTRAAPSWRSSGWRNRQGERLRRRGRHGAR